MVRSEERQRIGAEHLGITQACYLPWQSIVARRHDSHNDYLHYTAAFMTIWLGLLSLKAVHNTCLIIVLV